MRKILQIAGIAVACIAASLVLGELTILTGHFLQTVWIGLKWAWSGESGLEGKLIRAFCIGIYPLFMLVLMYDLWADHKRRSRQ